MKIESIRIQNFRCLKDETIHFHDYVCLVGSNGAGKSTVLNALNFFFKNDKDCKANLIKLNEDDFHHKNIQEPICITITFNDLSDEAKNALSDYVRNDKLVVSAIAKYDSGEGSAEVIHYGNRLGFEEFKEYFAKEKEGVKVKVDELREIYKALQNKYPELPDARSKTDMADRLRNYEKSNKDKCALIQSTDQFYGINSTGKLSPFIQWVFISASKDIVAESEESKNTAFGQLLARAVRSKINFTQKINELKNQVQDEYKKILSAEQSVLKDISASLQKKLQQWSHPDIEATICWDFDETKTVKIEEPSAYPQFGERGFKGRLSRFGHGLQRSYMLALLLELNDLNDELAPTLIMAIEEPEIYQHPPQAKYLSETLQKLTEKNSQVIVCSHSPLFIPGDCLEKIRMVRERGKPSNSTISSLTYDELSKTIADAGGKLIEEHGTMAKLYSLLNPAINEMFFCNTLVLVEGIEDAAYIMTDMIITGELEQFRKNGCHMVPANKKSNIIKLLAISNLLEIPTFIVFDADTDKEKDNEIRDHKKDNKVLLNLAGHKEENEWPSQTVWKNNMVMWKTKMSDTFKEEMGADWKKYYDKACAQYSNAGDLEKNPLAIASIVKQAAHDSKRSSSLKNLIARINIFSENVKANK